MSDDATTPLDTPVLSGIDDTRNGGPKLGIERAVLDAWMDEYRLNVLLKIDGLSPTQLAELPLPPSTLSLVGIIRHLTEVEEYWLREVVQGIDVPDRYCTREHPDGDFELASAETAADAVETYRREVARTAQEIGGWADLDTPVRGTRHGEPVNLRWILTHLIEEYARHLGHMDLLRESIDGTTGY